MDTATLQNLLLQAAQVVQRGVLHMLHALGLADTVHGQPAWPLPWRIAVENLVIDGGLARQVALWALMLAIAGVCLLVAVGWRRRRLPLALGAAALLLLAPWPPAGLLLTAAVPSSFHRSPTGFDATRIAHGLRLYQAQCAACHGTDGRGEGPQASLLATWPPTLGAGLLWKRAEGELLWRVQQGMHDRQGRTTMPGFAGSLGTDDTWAVLDAMKVLAAGDSARRQAAWPWPVAAPQLMVDCVDSPGPRPLSHWRGQRLRIVLAGGALPQPIEDPRFVTLVLGADAPPPGAECVVQASEAGAVYAQLAGLPDARAAAGLQFIVDRQGWLRAMARPGQGGWSEEDLLCRAEGASPSAAPSGAPASGLDALIARMEAEPVQVARLGVPHGR